MKVSELTGPRLDYWVAKAQGLDCVLECWMTMPPKPGAAWVLHNGKPDYAAGPYMPSSDWAHGGPIIEAEQIDIEHGSSLHFARHGFSPLMDGETVLVAAMRAYVRSKLGCEVEDVPKR